MSDENRIPKEGEIEVITENLEPFILSYKLMVDPRGRDVIEIEGCSRYFYETTNEGKIKIIAPYHTEGPKASYYAGEYGVKK